MTTAHARCTTWRRCDAALRRIEVYAAPPAVPANCRRHSSEAVRGLFAHPSVHSVFATTLGPFLLRRMR